MKPTSIFAHIAAFFRHARPAPTSSSDLLEQQHPWKAKDPLRPNSAELGGIHASGYVVRAADRARGRL